jgi:hypothetical protein
MTMEVDLILIGLSFGTMIAVVSFLYGAWKATQP